MEYFEFMYKSDDNKDGEKRNIVVSKCAENGAHDYEVCEMFEDFMRSVGFSVDNVVKYFRDE